MKWSQSGIALAAVIFGASCLGQCPADLQKQFNQLKREVQELEARLKSQESEVKTVRAENAELKTRLGEATHDPLETQINRLQDCCNACSVTVRSAASPITLGGEFRFRRCSTLGDSLVPIGGLDGPGVPVAAQEHDGHFTDARVDLNFRYDFGSRVTAFAELTSHWAFGDDPTGPIDDLNGNDAVGDVSLHQAWLYVGGMLGCKALSSRAGRMELVFGNQFQLGNADWYNGVVFDGGRIDWDRGCWKLTALTYKLSSLDGDTNQVSSFGTSHDDDELYGAYLTVRPNKCTTLDAYWLYVNGHGGASGQGSLNSGANAGPGFLYPGAEAYWSTVGARIGGKLDLLCGLDYNLEGAWQFGDVHDLIGSGADVDVDAFAVEGEVGVTFSKKSAFRVFVRGLYAEGPSDDDVGYLILFPNRHTFDGFRARYGLADLIPMTNVETLQAGVHFDPFRNWTFGATGLWAQANEAVVAGDDDYGYELDLWGEWRWSPQLVFSGGVAIVDPNDQGVALWSVDDDLQIIGYLQTRLVF